MVCCRDHKRATVFERMTWLVWCFWCGFDYEPGRGIPVRCPECHRPRCLHSESYEGLV